MVNGPTGEKGHKGDLNRALSVSFIVDGLYNDLDITGTETVHEIELKIRKAGEGQICPRDKRLGTAYVDVAPDPLAGVANLMLSYTWGYTLDKIKSSLARYCDLKGRLYNETCVWICCFCVNQHRVHEAKENKQTVSTEQFREVFQCRVRQAGKVVGLLSPWDNPDYLKRIWCLFEAWESTRIEGKIELDFVLPEEDEKGFVEQLTSNGLDSVNKVLGEIDCTKAEASVQADHDHILKLIEDESDSKALKGSDKLNNAIKIKLQAWFTATADQEIKRRQEDFDGKLGLEVADLYTTLGRNHECQALVSSMIKWCNGASPTDKNKGLKVQSKLHLRLARNYGNAGKQDESLRELEEAQKLAERARVEDPDPAERDKEAENLAEIKKTYGACHRKRGDLSLSFQFYQEALKILEEHHGESNLPMAAGWILLNLGLVQSLLMDIGKGSPMGRPPEYYFDQAGEIYRRENRLESSEYAWLIKNRGDYHMKEHRYMTAREDFEHASAIHRNLAKEHVENHGELLKSFGTLSFKCALTEKNDELKIKQFVEAAKYYEKAREIIRGQLTPEEALLESLENLACIYRRRGDTVSQEAARLLSRELEHDVIARRSGSTSSAIGELGPPGQQRGGYPSKSGLIETAHHPYLTTFTRGPQPVSLCRPSCSSAANAQSPGGASSPHKKIDPFKKMRALLAQNGLLFFDREGDVCVHWRVLRGIMADFHDNFHADEQTLFNMLREENILHFQEGSEESADNAIVLYEDFVAYLR